MEKIILQEDILKNFDHNATGIKGHLFGLPFTPETSSIVVIPVPWEVTVSYHSGAVNGPSAILDASTQVDLFVKDIPDAWKAGISMHPVPESLVKESSKLRELAAQHIARYENHGALPPTDPILSKIN